MASRDFWLSGKSGSLSPWMMAQTVAMLKLRSKQKLDVSYADIAMSVSKIGGGHPSKQAIALIDKFVSADPDWLPGQGKPGALKVGRKAVFTDMKKKQVAKSAMLLKKKGLEPTLGAMMAQAPAAVLNPLTNLPFSTPTLSKVLRERAYDKDPTDAWIYTTPLAKSALSEDVITARLAWARKLKQLNKQLHRDAQWYCDHVIWIDPCNTVVPAAKRTIFDQAQAARGKSKRWMSKGSKRKSRNLRATPYAGKQRQWADKRAWWMMVMTRGKVVLHSLPLDWPQTGPGMAWFVNNLRGILRKRFPAKQLPFVIATDRGPGFYQASQGTILAAYAEAIDANGFATLAGAEAKWQPPDIPDVLLHETAVAWVRSWFKKHPFKWVPKVEDNLKLFHKRLKECEKYINANYDVYGLCKSFPSRIEALIKSRGDRLRH